MERQCVRHARCGQREAAWCVQSGWEQCRAAAAAAAEVVGAEEDACAGVGRVGGMGVPGAGVVVAVGTVSGSTTADTALDTPCPIVAAVGDAVGASEVTAASATAPAAVMVTVSCRI